MKKVFLLVAIVLSSVVAVAQTNQVAWLNGRAVLGQSINQVDSLKFGEMVEADTLHLLLPRAVMVHDTVFVPYEVAVHDTVYVRDTVYVKDRSPLGVEMVDLGLSVKWASCNIGATKPEECGDYFAWGETSPKTDYSWSTYKHCNGSDSTITKYCVSSSYGTVDNKTTLEAEDDAAHVNWGGNWRMPTHAEMEELNNKCIVTWTDDYQGTGVAGRIFTGDTDKSIFLPAAGYFGDTSLGSVGTVGYYWPSSLAANNSKQAWELYFFSGYAFASYTYYRYYGQSVRAVCP